MEFELSLIRQVYFYESVCCCLESSTLGEMLNTNSEMRDIDEFSRWLDEESSVEELKEWLNKNYLDGYSIDDLYRHK